MRILERRRCDQTAADVIWLVHCSYAMDNRAHLRRTFPNVSVWTEMRILERRRCNMNSPTQCRMQLRSNNRNRMQCRNCNWIMQTTCNYDWTMATQCNVATAIKRKQPHAMLHNAVATAIEQPQTTALLQRLNKRTIIPAERIAISKNFSSRRLSIAISNDRRTNKTRSNSG